MTKLTLLFLGLSGLVSCSADPAPTYKLGLAAPTTTAVQVPRPATTPAESAAEPFLLHLPGIAGKLLIDLDMTHGLVAGGYRGGLYIYDWTEKKEALTPLWNVELHRREAKLIADQLTAAYDADPERPIYLTSHSGGTGLAVWSLELLPERVKVRNVLLLEPALSPTYDLTKALRHVSGRAYAFSSLKDPVVGLGCQLMGSIDGPKVMASGSVGFSRPETADAGQYSKLVSLPYSPMWVKWNNHGDHIGPMSPAFAAKVLTPLLLNDLMPPVGSTTKNVGR